jgi:amino acid transporter
LGQRERKLFVREASGLVREVSTSKAMFFNLASNAGNIVLWITPWFPLFGGAMIFGLAPIGVAHILTGIIIVLMALIFVVLVSVMPRSGGDYVYTSRIMYPFLGWIETWTLVWANVTIISFEIACINQSLQAFLTGMGAISASWSASAAWLLVPINQVIFGTILTILIGCMSLLKSRTFHTLLTALCIFAIAAALVMAVGAFFVNANVFAANFQKFTGNSTEQIISTAYSKGLSLAPLALTAFPAMIVFALWELIGFQYSGYIAGELKGNLKRNALVSMIGVIVLYLVAIWVVLGTAMNVQFGYEFINAWGYLYWFSPSNSPLNGVVPITSLYGLIGRPDLWPVWLFVTIGGCALMFALCPAYLVLLSRIIFAWSMDRVVPAWFAKIDTRTSSPLRVYFLIAVGGWAFYILSVYGLSVLSLAWYSVLLIALTWIFPGFNALLLPFRRKDLYQSSPWKAKVGLPIVSIIGILWLVFILPVYVTSYFQPILSTYLATPTQGLWTYTVNSGIALALVITVVGIPIYFISRWYNRRHGVDVDLIFKSIPPE